MVPLPERWREVPPTAGLPTRLSDWWPWGKRAVLRPAAISTAQVECSGTACLVVALTTLKQGSPRRNVIVPAYTCPLVPLAIAHCGLRVRLCDTRMDHFDMDPKALAALCDEDTLAIVPTHLGGRVADVAHAAACARSVGAWVIEDAAQAWGATVNGTSVGLLGDMGFFSLAVGKGITTYEGGVLVARDPAMREHLSVTSKRLMRTRCGLEALRLAQLLAYTAFYRPVGLRVSYGIPHRLALKRGDWIKAVGDSFSPTIPLHRMSRWRRHIAERSATRWPAFAAQLKAQATRRLQSLGKLPGIRVLQDPDGAHGAWPFFLLILPSQAARDTVLLSLAQQPLGVSRLFVHALPDYAYLASCVDNKAAVPNARQFAACSLTIANSPWLDDDAFESLVAQIANILAHFIPSTVSPASLY
jgi:perosamine synthetase